MGDVCSMHEAYLCIRNFSLKTVRQETAGDT
jgi:hypothetical protein